MASDRQVIQYLSPAELVRLMNASGVVTVQDTVTSDGKPVIHASVKVANAETGEQLPGGLPFSVVMFKAPNEPGYSNIAIGTIVPASELKVALPRDYFNFCNQRFRFTRVFPVDEQAFVIQMDLVLKNATREYVKFSFGLWGALFSQMLFELMGRGRESLASAAEAYAQAHTDFAQQIATMPDVAIPEPVEVPVSLLADFATEAPVEPEGALTLEAEAIVPVELAREADISEVAPIEDVEATTQTVSLEEITEARVAEANEPTPVGDPVEAAETEEPAEQAAEPELSIAAGPTAASELTPEVETIAQTTELAGEMVVTALGEEAEDDAKEVVPA